MPGVIVPRKTVGEVRKLIDDGEEEVAITLSDTKIRVAVESTVLTSKLIDGTFPDYDRVIPFANDKTLQVDPRNFAKAVDLVSTIATEKTRAIKLSLDNGSLVLSASSPEAGSAEEQLEVEYADGPLGDRLQLALPARYRSAHRRGRRQVHALGRGLADAGPRQRGSRRALRPYADARLTLRAQETRENAYAGAATMRPRLAVRRLTMTNFRNYGSARGDGGRTPGPADRRQRRGEDQPPGGALLSGAGARGCAARRWPRSRAAEGRREPGRSPPLWTARAGPVEVGTGIATAGEEPARRRAVRIDGADAASQADLAHYATINWLTPEMDRLFDSGASGRRRFLDRLVGGFDRDHAARVGRYERAMRERNRILKGSGPGGDAAWLGALETAMAETGVAVAAARRSLVGRLGAYCREAMGGFPRRRAGGSRARSRRCWERCRRSPPRRGVRERLATLRGRRCRGRPRDLRRPSERSRMHAYRPGLPGLAVLHRRAEGAADPDRAGRRGAARRRQRQRADPPARRGRRASRPRPPRRPVRCRARPRQPGVDHRHRAGGVRRAGRPRAAVRGGRRRAGADRMTRQEAR